MKHQNVYTVVHVDTLTSQQKQNIIQSKWVLRNKMTEVPARVVGKQFIALVTGAGNIYATHL